jgi:succinyl-CoA synthetase beta subunit
MAMLEINPLIETTDGKIIVLDAKVSFDSNALYRHPRYLRAARRERGRPCRDRGVEVRPRLYQARRHHRLYGQRRGPGNGDDGHHQAQRRVPANFLDVGGGASKEKVTAAFKLILSDPAVKGILVNIFGGIMKCDIIADGIVAGGEGSEPFGAAGGSSRRHQCAAGQGYFGGLWPADRSSRRSGRCRQEDRGAGKAGGLSRNGWRA